MIHLFLSLLLCTEAFRQTSFARTRQTVLWSTTNKHVNNNKVKATSVKVTALAEELVKAANEHVASDSSASIDKSLQQVKSSITSQTGNLVKSINELKEEVVDLSDTVLEQTRIQSLQWAISNAELNCFNYYEKSSPLKSTSLVRSILFSFMTGRGYYINDKSLKSFYYSNEVGEAEFRTALVSQIYELTGDKPRLEKDSGGWAIMPPS